jgi:hypothetical protein
MTARKETAVRGGPRRQNEGSWGANRWLALSIALVLLPSAAQAQWIDAQQPLGGEFQIGIEGGSQSTRARFTPDGQKQTFPEAFWAIIDSELEPGLSSLDSVLAVFYPALGLEAPPPSLLSRVSYDVLIEHTRVPISVSFGATDWLSVFGVVPLVKGKSFVGTLLNDRSAGDSITAFGGDAAGFLQGLNTGITDLEAIVAADTLGPVDQARAEALLAQAQVMEAGLTDLSSETFVPTNIESTGQELSDLYVSMQSGFDSFDLSIPDLALAAPIDTARAVGMTSGPEWGIEAPETRDTGLKFGDMELGLSLQPLNSFRATPRDPRPKVPMRLKLDALYRFPTGAPPAPNRIFDPGTGQGQPDIEVRGTFDIAYGSRFWMSLYASYNLQLEADIERLVTTPAAPIQLGAYTALVRWNPGDVLTLAVAPRFNLTRVITFAGLYRYQKHGLDAFAAAEAIDPGAAFVPSDLALGTEWNSSSVGFAARYQTTDWSGDRRRGLPMEVELRYLKVVSGRNGYVPERSSWEIASRFYWGLFR